MKIEPMARRTLPLTLALLTLLSACTTLQNARGGPGQRLDPWENWNRKVFAFNEALDKNVLKPVATAYSKVVPQPVRRGVDNFFNNFADAWSAVNNLLQGKVQYSLESVFRVGTNSVFGVLGLVDVATEVGLERRNEDFGQTLGVWGVGPGAYIVWPLLGSSTVRDSFAMPVDWMATPGWIIDDGRLRFGLTALQIVNTRANLLGASQVLDDIALDKYTFLRDAYLQRRGSLIFDGEPSDIPGADANSPTTAPGPAASTPPR